MIGTKKGPLVSVVMSVYNGRPYLAHAVDSILAQTFRDFEFIIIDDGSTDGTAEELQKYAVRDARIRLRFQKRLGLAKALNAGLTVARGKYIARMDADDISHPDRLALQMEHLLRNSNLVLLGTAFEYIDAKNKYIKTQLLATGNENLQSLLVDEGNQFCHPSVIMSADAIQKAGFYRCVAGRHAQDYDLWLRIAGLGEIDNLSTPLLRYRVHESQKSIKNLLAQRHSAETYKNLAKIYRSSGKEDVPAAIKLTNRNLGPFFRSVARDYIHWYNLFQMVDDTKNARLVWLKALWMFPLNSSIRQMVLDSMKRCLFK